MIRQLLVTALGCVALFCVACARDDQPVLTGTVTNVVDGDTVDVVLASGPIRIRLHGIDTPEPKQPHGKESTAALSRLVLNKQVDVEPFEQDRYDRLVGIIFLGKTNVNAELIREGHAWAYRRYMRKSDAQLCNYEDQARRAKRGLWAGPDDELEAPWEWRKKSLKYVTDFSDETAADCIAAIGKR